MRFEKLSLSIKNAIQFGSKNFGYNERDLTALNKKRILAAICDHTLKAKLAKTICPAYTFLLFE
jgi:hypothetical protein